jgi:putative peptide zinc metalloprotease protein
VAPALLEYQQHTKLYAPDGAQVVKINVKNDQYVEANTVLIELDSAELDNKVEQVKQDIAIMEYRISKEAGHTAELGLSQTDQSELATKNSELASLEAQRQKLIITAPFAGTVEGLNETLSIGQSIKKNLPLCEIIDSSHNTITTYVQERDYNRLRSDKTAIFFPDAYNASPVVKARLITIDPVSTTALEKPYLASTFGGSIAVQGDRQQLAPKEALYRVVLAPITPVKDLEFVTRGTVRLSGSPISLLGQVWTSISAVFIRESGF